MPEKELTNEEYTRLLNAAKAFADDRMYILIKTLCGAGLQVSELKYITVKSVYVEEILIPCGKRFRTVFYRKNSVRNLNDTVWIRKYWKVWCSWLETENR